jgi:hypothetical protein
MDRITILKINTKRRSSWDSDLAVSPFKSTSPNPEKRKTRFDTITERRLSQPSQKFFLIINPNIFKI